MNDMIDSALPAKPKINQTLLSIDTISDAEFEDYIASLNPLDLSNFKKKMALEIKELEAIVEEAEGYLAMVDMMKQTVDSIRDIEDNITEEAADAEVESSDLTIVNPPPISSIVPDIDPNLGDDLRAFVENSPEMIDKLNARCNRVLEVLEDYRDDLSSSVALTNHMVTTIQKRIDELKESSDLNKDIKITSYEVVANATKNRYDYSVLLNKLNTNEELFPRLVKKLKGEYMKRSKARMNSAFTDKNKFETCMDSIIRLYPNNSNYSDTKLKDAATLVVTYLGRLMYKGKSDGTYIYPRLIVMNIDDINKGIYDFPDKEKATIDAISILMNKFMPYV